jgi:hypothetical protein
MNWQYTNATQTVAYRVLDDGRMESCLASVLPEGTVIDPYIPPPPPIPATVTRFQALATLAAGGYLDTVHAYIDTLPRSNITRLAFENAGDWERTSPTVNALAAMLGLTDAQVDDLFIAADQVSA